ncbi:MAG: anti-sigma factor, partial [Solirubrobacteraceae bacterium]
VSLDLGSSSSSPARVLQAQVVGPGSAQLRIAGGRASLVVHRLPSPPPGKIYELWLQHGNRAPSPAGLFSVTAGSADVGVPGSLHGVTHVMVTPEPSGGSQVPTHAPVITVTLA